MHLIHSPAFIYKLNRDHIHIYWIPISWYKIYFLNFTHSKEIEFVNHHINNPMRQTQFLAVRSLLRYLFQVKTSTYLGEVTSDVAGVPIVDMELHRVSGNFSFSHNKKFVGLALNQKSPIGFDIESCDRDFLKIKDKFISKEEIDYLIELQKNQKNSALSIQTLMGIAFSFKESVFKAIFPTYKKSFYFEHCILESICIETNQIFARVDSFISGYPQNKLKGFFYWNQEDSLIFTWLEIKPS